MKVYRFFGTTDLLPRSYVLILAFIFTSPALASEEGSSIVTPLIPQIVWAFLSFTVVLIILAKGAWPVIMEALDERAKRIEENLKAAERARLEAEQDKEKLKDEIAKERLRLRETLVRLEEDIARRRAAILEEAQREALRIRKEALATLEEARKELLSEVASEAVEIALAASEKLLSMRVSEDVDRRLVESSIKALVENSGKVGRER